MERERKKEIENENTHKFIHNYRGEHSVETICFTFLIHDLILLYGLATSFYWDILYFIKMLFCKFYIFYQKKLLSAAYNKGSLYYEKKYFAVIKVSRFIDTKLPDQKIDFVTK